MNIKNKFIIIFLISNFISTIKAVVRSSTSQIHARAVQPPITSVQQATAKPQPAKRLPQQSNTQIVPQPKNVIPAKITSSQSPYVATPKPANQISSVHGGPSFASRAFSTPNKPPASSSMQPFRKYTDASHDQNKRIGSTGIAVVPIFVPAPVVVVQNQTSSDQQMPNTSQPDNNSMQQSQPASSPIDQQDQSQNQTSMPVSDPSLETAISLSPQLKCPPLPDDLDNLSDADYQKRMDTFRNDNFDTNTISNTETKADNCQDQCKTELPGKCYTGFTSDDNKCECAIQK